MQQAFSESLKKMYQLWEALNASQREGQNTQNFTSEALSMIKEVPVLSEKNPQISKIIIVK